MHGPTKVKSKHTFVFNNLFTENLSFVRKSGKNMVERSRALMAIRRIGIACWISEAIDTHSKYVIIFAFPQQQLLHECTSMLRLIVHCLSCFLRQAVLTEGSS
jgi:hypothetical protein